MNMKRKAILILKPKKRPHYKHRNKNTNLKMSCASSEASLHQAALPCPGTWRPRSPCRRPTCSPRGRRSRGSPCTGGTATPPGSRWPHYSLLINRMNQLEATLAAMEGAAHCLTFSSGGSWHLPTPYTLQAWRPSAPSWTPSCQGTWWWPAGDLQAPCTSPTPGNSTAELSVRSAPSPPGLVWSSLM